MQDELKRYINEDLLDAGEGATIDEDDDLLASGLVDSIGVMQVVAFVEEHAGIRVPPEDVTIETFRTIRAISAYVASRRQAD